MREATWSCAKHLILFHITFLSVSCRDMDLMGGPLRGQGIVWMTKELQSMAPCPSGEKCEECPTGISIVTRVVEHLWQ